MERIVLRGLLYVVLAFSVAIYFTAISSNRDNDVLPALAFAVGSLAALAVSAHRPSAAPQAAAGGLPAKAVERRPN